MPRFLLCGLALLGLGSAHPARHAYHASITELRYNAAGRQLELSIKVFTDDFEKALSKGQPAPVRLDAPGPLVGILTSSYLTRTVAFRTSSGAALPLQFLGLQAEKDAYWLYCKVPLPQPMKSVQLRHTLLLDTFADQANVVNVEAGAKKSSALFRSGHEQEVLAL